MFPPMIRCIILMCSVLYALGCSTPGYYVRIDAEYVPPGLIDGVRSAITEKGFERLPDTKAFDDMVVSTYWKDLPGNQEYYYIQVVLILTLPMTDGSFRKVQIEVKNLLRGTESPIRFQIDEIADTVYKGLSEIIGPNRVRITREQKGPPLLY
jgi:hypothetical protein